MSGPNAFPQYLNCYLCRDAGVALGGEYPFKWCACEAGVKRKAAEPDFVDEANAERDALGIGAPK